MVQNLYCLGEFFSFLRKPFPVANSHGDSGFPGMPANFTRHNPLRTTNGNPNENIYHFFGSDLILGHEYQESLLNNSKANINKQDYRILNTLHNYTPSG